MRNVWRAPFRDAFFGLDSMFKIYCDSYHFRDACLQNHSVRNVWRVSPFDSGALLGLQLGHLNRSPTHSGTVPLCDRFGSGWWPFGVPTSPRGAPRNLRRHARGYSLTSGRLSSVAGSAMHMKLLDGIGREAGIGRARNEKGLRVFRACPR